jgi:uncharacterized protein (TIGR02391 family)
MAQEPGIKGELLESLCNVLSQRLTHAEITKYLIETGLTDTNPELSKPKRLYNSFVEYQNREQRSNKIQIFIQKSFSPLRFTSNNSLFEEIRSEINIPLAFIGLELIENGNYKRVDKAKTISEATQRADKLKQTLRDRNVHPDVLLFCKPELLQDNYFHAVFETTKSVADKIRNKSGLTADGSELVDKCFGLGQNKTPLLSFNSLKTESEESEHKGFSNLIKGMFGMFRNTTAHAPKIQWSIDEHDALDCLTLASLIHRKLDKCK